MNIVFRKTGKEIKAAVQKRREQLQQRLNKRNQVLDEFFKDTAKVRSYLIRSQDFYLGRSHGQVGYPLYSQNDISSEERQEIDQLCQRIFEIEQELHRLALLTTHLDDDQIFDLSFNDLIGYGFEANLQGDIV